MVEAEKKISQGIVTLITLFPFFATVILKLKRVCDPTCDTMWTDGHSLGYSPKFVNALSRDELVSVLIHEVLHVTGLHPWRRGTRDPHAWNIACDQVINAIIEEMGRPLPKGTIPGVPDKAAEELYQHPPPGQKGGGQGDPGGMGEVRDATNPDGSPLSEAERERQMQEAKITIQQALNAAKRAGQLPKGLARFVEDLLEPQVPWREILARFVDQFAKQDYNWSRPNRRFVGQGIILPSLWSPAIGNIVMGCDTSGSINQTELKEVCSEVLGVLENYAESGQDPELTVAWFDTKVYPQIVSDASELSPKGGGGTSFSVVFDWMRKEGINTKGVIMVTDGYCNDFGEAPDVPVLWILTRKHPNFKPPFGEIAYTLNE